MDGKEELEMYRSLSLRLEYKDGKLFWKKAWKKLLIGTEAGRRDSNGYLRIHPFANGQMVSVHRIIFW